MVARVVLADGRRGRRPRRAVGRRLVEDRSERRARRGGRVHGLSEVALRAAMREVGALRLAVWVCARRVCVVSSCRRASRSAVMACADSETRARSPRRACCWLVLDTTPTEVLCGVSGAISAFNRAATVTQRSKQPSIRHKKDATTLPIDRLSKRAGTQLVSVCVAAIRCSITTAPPALLRSNRRTRRRRCVRSSARAA